MPVSSEYIISCELLYLTSTAGQTSRIFLAYVIPCAIYNMHSSMPRSTDLNFGICTVLSRFVPTSKPVNIEVESWSHIPSQRLRCRHAVLCMYYKDDLLPNVPLPLCSYWGHGQEFITVE